MAQIFQRPTSVGEALGTGLGSGISSGLQQLAQMKLQEMQTQRQQGQTLSGLKALLPGRSEQEYLSLSQTPLELLQPFLKQEMQRPQEEAYAQALSQLLGTPNLQPPMQQANQQSLSPLSPQVAPRLSSQQATKLAELQMKMQKQEDATKLKKQQQIIAANKPFVEKLNSDIRVAEQVTAIAEQMQKLLDTGKVRTGIKGFIPTVAQNDESQQFEALSNDLATLLASSGSGVATNFKIKLAQQRKPNLTQTANTQRALVKRLLDESQKPLTKGQIRDQLLAENQYEEPANIESRINEIFKQRKSVVNEKNLIKRLGKPQEDGTVVEDNGEYFIVSENKWQPISQNDPRLEQLLQGA